MSVFAYNTMTMILGAAVLIALGVALYSFVFMLVRWKTPKRRRHIVRLILALVAISFAAGIQYSVLFFIFLPALGRQQMAEINAATAENLAETSVLQVGDSAPQFSLTTADGDDFSLPVGGKVILINFFATWCGPCQIELPHLERIWVANKSNEHFRVLIIGREETTESVREYRDKNDFSFPIAADPDRAVYSLFAKESIPRTLVVSPEGRIVYSKSGFNENDLDELKAVLREQFASVK
jgi:peroxiredoxin